jgi:molecular chaperone GrpE
MKQKLIDHKKDNQISDNESTLENETWEGNQEPQENGSGPEMNESQEEIVKLQDQLQEKDAVVEEYLSMLQQLQAEFQNYKKRVERERSAVIEQATGDLIYNLLLVLDNFERALQSDASDIQSYRKGVEMIFSQLQRVLEAEGLSPIPAVGEHFDPYYHEAVLTAQGDYEDDTILEELEKGYLLNNRVLRPSKVKVGKRGE